VDVNLHYSHANEIYTVRLTPQPDGTFEIIVGEQAYRVELKRNYSGELVLSIDNRLQKAHFASQKPSGQSPARFYVDLGRGATYQVEKYEPTTHRRGAGASGAGNLSAQMPGQIMHVLVAEGEAVSLGQPLLIMEAMKMEIRVSSPCDGVVRRLLVQTGDTVDRGQQLVEIEENQ
jgi:biotin carboxyl carrier protein